jgi:hypothetical protein
VLAVDYENVAVAGSEADGVLIEADWSVGGIVSHQQHKHHRINRYQAIYTLALADGDADAEPSLHIVDTRMRIAERVATPLSSTEGFPLDDLPASERGFLGPAELLKSGILDDAAEQPPPASAPEEKSPAGEDDPRR